MKIVFFSDPHGLHYESTIPDGDMIICCGDISLRGTRSEVNEFLDWYAELPHKHKIFIAGNHDFWFEPDHKRNRSLRPGENPRDIIPEGIIYLEDETVEIEGIKIFGSPWTPWFHSWAFNGVRCNGQENVANGIKQHWDLIEEGTDIVVVHGPPSGTFLERCKSGDMVGCVDLTNRLKEIKPKICSFGHIHEAYGTDDMPHEDGKVTRLINCSVLNLQYYTTNKPVVVDWDEICELHENTDKNS